MADQELLKTDILVVGGGIAGCAAAIAAAEQGQQVVLMEKAWTGASGASTFASGGFYWFDPKKHSIKKILENASKSTAYMFDPAWMEWFCYTINELILKLDQKGVPFFKDENGQFIIKKSRGGTELVIVPGYVLQKKMRSLVLAEGVQILDRVALSKLIKSENGKVIGATGFNVRTGKFHVIEAKNIIIASGGCSYKGNFFGQDMLCGEGMFHAAEAGAEFTNMEFSNTYNTTSKEFDLFGMGLFPQYGAKFLNGKNEYFMERYDPEHKDCSLLNIVIMAMAKEVKEGRGPIYFDMRPIAKKYHEEIKRIVPLFFEAFASKNIDPFAQPLEWVPAFIGAASCGSGLTLQSFSCDTNIPGLYAAGDASNEGLIIGGSNGPGGINLSWALVTGWKAGEAAARSAHFQEDVKIADRDIAEAKQSTFSMLGHKGTLTIDNAVLKIQQYVIPQQYNIIRNPTALHTAIEELQKLKGEINQNIIVSDTHELMCYHELCSMIEIAEMTFTAALFRTESRGSHFREDMPKTDNGGWLKWTVLSKTNDGYAITSHPIPFEKYNHYGLALPR